MSARMSVFFNVSQDLWQLWQMTTRFFSSSTQMRIEMIIDDDINNEIDNWLFTYLLLFLLLSPSPPSAQKWLSQLSQLSQPRRDAALVLFPMKTPCFGQFVLFTICGHLVKVIWSKSISGTRSLLTIYKYKYLYYSGGFWQSVFDFDKWPNDQMTAQDKNRQNNLGYVFVDRNGNVVPLHCQKWATRRIADSKTPARWKQHAVSLWDMKH